MIDLFLDSITDANIREVFKKLASFLDRKPFLTGDGEFVEITIKADGTISYPHQLKFKPKDVIQLSQIGTGTITWQYKDFTKTSVKLVAAGVSGQVTVRAFIGTFGGGN